MLREYLDSGIFNLSALAERAGVKRQNLHKYKREGNGLTEGKVSEIIKIITNVINITPVISKPDKSKVKKVNEVPALREVVSKWEGKLRTADDYEWVKVDRAGYNKLPEEIRRTSKNLGDGMFMVRVLKGKVDSGGDLEGS